MAQLLDGQRKTQDAMSAAEREAAEQLRLRLARRRQRRSEAAGMRLRGLDELTTSGRLPDHTEGLFDDLRARKLMALLMSALGLSGEEAANLHGDAACERLDRAGLESGCLSLQLDGLSEAAAAETLAQALVQSESDARRVYDFWHLESMVNAASVPIVFSCS